MRFTIKHGASLDVLTPNEARRLLAENAYSEPGRTRIRATQHLTLDANGAGTLDVYDVPPGFEFEARRVVLDIDTATTPGTGNVLLNAAGAGVEYLRSGTRIEWANPLSPGGIASIPGSQSWGAEQGPYLQNGEIFQARFTLPTVGGARVSVALEGILTRPNPAR